MPVPLDRCLERSVVGRAWVLRCANSRVDAPRGYLLVIEVIRRAPELHELRRDLQKENRVLRPGRHVPVDLQYVIIDSVEACVETLTRQP